MKKDKLFKIISILTLQIFLITSITGNSIALMPFSDNLGEMPILPNFNMDVSVAPPATSFELTPASASLVRSYYNHEHKKVFIQRPLSTTILFFTPENPEITLEEILEEIKLEVAGRYGGIKVVSLAGYYEPGIRLNLEPDEGVRFKYAKVIFDNLGRLISYIEYDYDGKISKNIYVPEESFPEDCFPGRASVETVIWDKNVPKERLKEGLKWLDRKIWEVSWYFHPAELDTDILTPNEIVDVLSDRFSESYDDSGARIIPLLPRRNVGLNVEGGDDNKYIFTISGVSAGLLFRIKFEVETTMPLEDNEIDQMMRCQPISQELINNVGDIIKNVKIKNIWLKLRQSFLHGINSVELDIDNNQILYERWWGWGFWYNEETITYEIPVCENAISGVDINLGKVMNGELDGEDIRTRFINWWNRDSEHFYIKLPRFVNNRLLYVPIILIEE